MASINPIASNSSIQQITSKPIRKEIAATESASATRTDKVDISGVSHLLAALKTNQIRTDVVSNVRAQIEAGTYETDDKLNAAADRLLDDLMK